MDASIRPSLHHQHLHRGVAVPHCCPGSRVRAGALVLHPAIQRIEFLEIFIDLRLRHKIFPGTILLFLLHLLVLTSQLFPLLRFGGFLFPAVDLLHQRGNVLRQPDAPGQILPGAPEQPLTIHRLAARIKSLFSGVQHRTAGLL